MRNDFLCLAAFVLALSPCSALAQNRLSAEDSVAAETLAQRIALIAQTLPKGTPQSVYEARFSVAVANFNGKCNAALAGLNAAASQVGAGPAQLALKNVQAVAARCESGTGAGTANGNNAPRSVAPPSLPDLNTGGSSNYLQ